MAFSSNSIINHRREGIYKGPLSSTSSKGSSSSTKRFGIDFENSPRLPLNLKNLSKASLSKPSPKLLHSSHTFKKSNMSSSSSSSLSKKRSRENDPFEIEAYPAPTGVEEMGSAPAKRSCPETGRSEVDIYRRRKKVTKYAASIRQNKTLARKASGSYARMPTSAQKGISNPGPLCYRISLLQTLLHQPKFVNWLLESHRPKDCVSDRPDECVPCFLVHLVLAYWKGEQHSVKISAAFHGIDKLFEYLGWASDVAYGHADPDEQASWMFGAMRAVMPSSTFASLQSFTHLITASAIRCKCGHESRTEGHTDRGFSLAITPKIQNGTVAQYLHRYMIEVIEGYKCEKCKDDSKKHRVLLIDHAPDILCVQLKRFRWDGTKDSSPVGIDTTLILDKYRDTANTDHLWYGLTAVIKHQGNGGFGHYICYSKGPDGAWYKFNDSSVSRSSEGDATSSHGSNGGFTPYMVFYQRKET